MAPGNQQVSARNCAYPDTLHSTLVGTSDASRSGRGVVGIVLESGVQMGVAFSLNLLITESGSIDSSGIFNLGRPKIARSHIERIGRATIRSDLVYGKV